MLGASLLGASWLVLFKKSEHTLTGAQRVESLDRVDALKPSAALLDELHKMLPAGVETTDTNEALDIFAGVTDEVKQDAIKLATILNKLSNKCAPWCLEHCSELLCFQI